MKRILFYIFIILLISSCSNDDVVLTQKLIQVAGKISEPAQTRVRDMVISDGVVPMWELNDEIGVFAYNQDKNYFNKEYINYGDRINGNTCFTPITSSPICIDLVDGKLTMYGYYPYRSDDEFIDDKRFLFDASKQDDSLNILTAQPIKVQSDNPSADLHFTHTTAKVVLNVKAGQGVSLDDIKSSSTSLKVSEIITKANYNVFTGEYELLDDENRDTKIVLHTTPIVHDDFLAYELYFIPQDLPSETLSFDIEVAGINYYVNLQVPTLGEEKSSLHRGVALAYNLTVNKANIEISSANVRDWEVKFMGEQEVGRNTQDEE